LAIHQNITVENGDDSAPVFSEKWLRGKPVAENTNCESIHKRPVGFDEIVSEVIRMCEAAMVTGDFDLMLKARIADMEELNKVVVANLRKHRGIGESITMISYRTVEKA
jgi:DNA-binding Lrp family transcriptional regulator